MNKGCRLRAKGEKIIFDTEDGKKEFVLMPLKNKQLLEITELGEKAETESKSGLKAAFLLAKYCLNNNPKVQESEDGPFTDEEIREMETCFLLPLVKKAAKINGMEDLFDFQLRGGRLKPDPKSLPNTSEKPISKVIGDSPRQTLS